MKNRISSLFVVIMLLMIITLIPSAKANILTFEDVTEKSLYNKDTEQRQRNVKY